MADTFDHKHAERQYQMALLRAQWWIASATSGHYKQRNLQQGTDEKSGDGRIVFRDLTDDEKLAECMVTALRHIERAMECSDALAMATAEDSRG